MPCLARPRQARPRRARLRQGRPSRVLPCRAKSKFVSRSLALSRRAMPHHAARVPRLAGRGLAVPCLSTPQAGHTPPSHVLFGAFL
jgi:hypothetical protein